MPGLGRQVDCEARLITCVARLLHYAQLGRAAQVVGLVCLV